MVENMIRYRLVEGAFVSIGSEIELERFPFQAALVRLIINLDLREIRLSGNRAEGSEISRLKLDPIRTSRRVGESFQDGGGWRRRDTRFAAPEESETFFLLATAKPTVR